jgi:hypothetical protein
VKCGTRYTSLSLAWLAMVGGALSTFRGASMAYFVLGTSAFVAVQLTLAVADGREGKRMAELEAARIRAASVARQTEAYRVIKGWD